MKTATALLQSAEAHGIVLWVDGDQLRYRARQAVSDGMKERIRENKAEIINLLKSKTCGSDETTRVAFPDWCNPRCECFHRLELPGLEVVQGCYLENDERNWQWAKLDKMKSCPRAGRK